VALVLAEVATGSPALARLGLIVGAILLQTLVSASPGHFRPAGNPFFASFVTAGTVGALALALLASLPIERLGGLRFRRALGLLALAAICVLSINGTSQALKGVWSVAVGNPYSNDGAVMDLYAAQQTLHLHNPYLKANIVRALAQLDAPSTTTTPLMAGQFGGARAYPSPAAVAQVFTNDLRYRPRVVPPEFESKYNYPSGSFLFILPFVWAGIHDMRFLYAIVILLMGAYLWRRMPPSLRVLVPLVILADVPLMQLTAGGQPDPIYGLFLMLGLAEWSTPWLSPFSMGLASGTKQLTWFFLPFYFLIVAQHLGWREAGRRALIVGSVSLLMNAPFILWSPSAYLASVFAPMRDPMFPLGVGIIALFVSNVLPMAPRVLFTVLELGSWIAGTAAFAFTRFLTPAGAVALAALPLFFAWRSLVNYFYLVPLLTLACVLASRYQQQGTAFGDEAEFPEGVAA
jgi:hypothetical protein